MPVSEEEEAKRLRNILEHVGCPHGRDKATCLTCSFTRRFHDEEDAFSDEPADDEDDGFDGYNA